MDLVFETMRELTIHFRTEETMFINSGPLPPFLLKLTDLYQCLNKDVKENKVTKSELCRFAPRRRLVGSRNGAIPRPYQDRALANDRPGDSLTILIIDGFVDRLHPLRFLHGCDPS